MSKNNMSFFALSLVIITFLGGCKTFDGNESVSFSSKVQQSGESMSNFKKSQAINEVKISYSLEETQVSLHQPIILNFTVQNDFTQPVNLNLGQDRKEGFLFILTLPDGKKIQLPQYSREGISRTGNLLLEPQQIYTQKILLNEWADFASVGKYKIDGRLADPIKTENGKIIKTDSNFSVALDVQPRNAEYLEKISASLLERIIQSDNYEESAENALTLSYMNDPVAVPYLQKALTSNKMVESIVINGLERIGNKTAVQVLIDTINEKPNSEIASLAMSSLDMIERKSSDLEIKERIKQNLPPK